jgi:hypothetical protein
LVQCQTSLRGETTSTESSGESFFSLSTRSRFDSHRTAESFSLHLTDFLQDNKSDERTKLISNTFFFILNDCFSLKDRLSEWLQP